MGFWLRGDFGADGIFCTEGISYGWDLSMAGIKFRGVSLYKALENS